MKIVFFGTSELAVSALQALLLSKHRILGVVTAQDKRKGRGLELSFSPVKIFAQNKGMPIVQPADLRDTKFLYFLKNSSADLFVVCAYGKILTKEILQIPKVYAINLHTSLLPKYRGAAPINWAIIAGEKESGVTVFKMNEEMDKGEIILQQRTGISFSDTAVSLAEKLSRIGKDALLKSIDLIEHKGAHLREQDENQATFAPKLKKEDGLIGWGNSALEIYNRIRGLQPWPGAFTYFENKLLKIWQSQIVQGKKSAEPGEIVEVDTKNGILVQAGKNKLLIIRLQLEGKKEMPAAKFILGHRIEVGRRLGK